MLKSKKLLSLLIAATMIASTGVYASAVGRYQRNAVTSNAAAASSETSGTSDTTGTSETTAATAAKGYKNTAEYKEAKAKFAEYKAEFQANKAQIQSLREQIKTCAAQLKSQLENADPDEITAQQMLAYKEAIQELKEARDLIKSEHKGQIQTQIQNMKQARENHNYGKAELAFEKIIKEQEARIVILQGILKDLQSVLVSE